MAQAEAIPHNRPLITPADRAAVDAVLASGWIAQGPEVLALEASFDALYGGGGSCALSSGTAALFLALKTLGMGPGKRVAVPTYACSALLNAVYMAGAEPWIADVEAEDFNIDPGAVERAAGGRKPDAIIAVHSYGARADVAALKAVGGAVIEDCCQSLGGAADGGNIGNDGDAAVFSFYATKIVACGHGGLMRDPDGRLADAARDYREFDQRESYEERFNLHMSDIEAAMARSQMSRLGDLADRRRATAARYLESLPAGIDAAAGVGDAGRMVYRFVLRFADSETRDRARAALAARGIEVIVPLERYELLHRYLGLDPAEFPVAENIVDTTLSLPVFPALTDAQVDRICAALATLEC